MKLRKLPYNSAFYLVSNVYSFNERIKMKPNQKRPAIVTDRTVLFRGAKNKVETKR
jgi:hypothetical protein